MAACSIGSHIGQLVNVSLVMFLLAISSRVGWRLSVAKYRDKIVTIFNVMHSIRSSLLPENINSVNEYINAVRRQVIQLALGPELGDLPEDLMPKFEAFVQYEEERMRKNLEEIRYDIDELSSVYLVAGSGRIEKVCRNTINDAFQKISHPGAVQYLFPLMYLLLQRDLERFRAAQTRILNQEELTDAASTIQWVYYAAHYRMKDLSGEPAV